MHQNPISHRRSGRFWASPGIPDLNQGRLCGRFERDTPYYQAISEGISISYRKGKLAARYSVAECAIDYLQHRRASQASANRFCTVCRAALNFVPSYPGGSLRISPGAG